MFNIDERFEEKWIKFEDDVEFLIRFISPDRLEKKYKDSDGNLKDINDMIDFVIRDWKGILRNEKKTVVKLPCNTANKLMILDEFPSLFNFIVMENALKFSTFLDKDKNLKN